MGAAFDLALSQQLAGFKASFTEPSDGSVAGYRAVLRAEANIDLHKAESYDPIDKRWIIALVERTVGCSSLNSSVLQARERNSQTAALAAELNCCC